ncbi:MAG: hypothetical protein ABT02_19055 [Comamonadaceae bacterium SCN 68-20]|nr:MAG: hypothetical protein ABT02_19055 [Comamonadaceae bacterium SCN 68-20]
MTRGRPDATAGAAVALARAMLDALDCAPPVDSGAAFPRAWWKHLADRRLLGLGFDLDGRGARAGWPEIARLAGLVAEQTASLGLALAWLLNEMVGRFVIGAHANTEGQRAMLRMMASGRLLVGMAISEPDAGSHPKRMACAAVRDGDRWLLNGRKSHVSNGPAADAFVVLAVTGEIAGRRAFDAFVVDAGHAGLQVHPAAAAALAPLGQAALLLNGCAVPDARRLDTQGDAYRRIVRPMRIVEDALLAGAIIGAMRCEMRAFAAWLQGTQPAPATARRLGAFHLELVALEALADQAAQHLERHGPDDALAGLNVGTRLAFARWQADFEGFAATFDDLGDRLHAAARDVRTVLGIARATGERRQLDAGAALLNSKESDEVAA